MSILQKIRRYYDSQGIGAVNFRCKHLCDCKRNCDDFTEAREPFIGPKYENVEGVPRLLFLSLDSGDGEPEPEKRTLEALRDWETNSCRVADLPKNKHWYRTHELAFELLRVFKPELTIQDSHSYFAHTNSAKCSMNKKSRAVADWRLFNNCREYIPGEVSLLSPDVLVTQGDMALHAIQGSFVASVKGNQKECGYAVLALGSGKQALWLHTYHPRHFGGFNRQRKNCWPFWVEVTRRFMSGRLPL